MIYSSNSNTFTVAQPALSFADVPSLIYANEPFSLTVKAQNGNSPYESNATVKLSIVAGPGTLKGEIELELENGIAVFDSLTIDTTGFYGLRAQAVDDEFLASATISFVVNETPSPAPDPIEDDDEVDLDKAVLPKVGRLHDLLPEILNSRRDRNWSALVEAIGEEDDRLAKLIEEVRNQFFVKTANRPYLDRLAANNNLSRPKFIGIGDTAFRKYIPILSYQPKQVRHVIDSLLDLFFFKEATTAFLSSASSEPFLLKDGWDLRLLVDNVHEEYIVFNSQDFDSIFNATAEEIVATYNRQAKHSYAAVFVDHVTQQNHIRIFTNTSGTQGSLEIIGGLANIELQLNGFMFDLGRGENTAWNVSKVGDTVTFKHIGGASPGLDRLQIGDIFLCDIPENEGSFSITAVDISNRSFQFINMFGEPGIFTQFSSRQAKFLRPEKFFAYKSPRRALTWETQPGQITVEMPVTPSIVQREPKGGFFINGSASRTIDVNSNSLTVEDASNFPPSGQFIIEPVQGTTVRLTENEFATYFSNGRLISNLVKYSYSEIQGNTLLNITPNLPTVTKLHEIDIETMTKTNGQVVCQMDNNFSSGERVIISGSSGIPILSTTGTTTANSPILSSVGSLANVVPGMLVQGDGIPEGTKVLSVNKGNAVAVMSDNAEQTGSGPITFSENTNGTFQVVSATPTSFSFNQLGVNGVVTTPGVASVERVELASQGSKIIVTSARLAKDTGITGPYIWDSSAPFVLSSQEATAIEAVNAGKTVKMLEISAGNSLPSEGSYVIFDYGQNNQEGPVRYLYKAADNILAFDPSYTFQQNHAAGCSIVALSHKGPHIMSGTGAEYPPYLTNPSNARLILEDLIKSVSSAGFFIDFLVRYPTQLYGTLSVYD